MRNYTINPSIIVITIVLGFMTVILGYVSSQILYEKTKTDADFIIKMTTIGMLFATTIITGLATYAFGSRIIEKERSVKQWVPLNLLLDLEKC